MIPLTSSPSFRQRNPCGMPRAIPATALQAWELVSVSVRCSARRCSVRFPPSAPPVPPARLVRKDVCNVAKASPLWENSAPNAALLRPLNRRSGKAAPSAAPPWEKTTDSALLAVRLNSRPTARTATTNSRQALVSVPSAAVNYRSCRSFCNTKLCVQTQLQILH